MAGKGTELATSFEQIKEIIDGCNNSHVKVCLDTCHINDAGYDLNDFVSLSTNGVSNILGILASNG